MSTRNTDPMLEPTERGITIPLGGGELYCAVDDYTDGWTAPDAVLTVHGIAEHGGIWRGWVPHLAREHRVLRPDLRGYGRSSPLPEGFTIDDWADDLEALLAALGQPRVHLVATKLGAQVAFVLAQRRLPQLASMTLAGMLPSPNAALGPWLDDFIGRVEKNGVADWATATMAGRMGTCLSPEAMAWWTRLMSAAPQASVLANLKMLPSVHGPATPEQVACPVLFIAAASKPAPGSYNQQPDMAELKALQARVPDARMQFVEADSFHITATHPDACARLTAQFIADVNSRRPG